MIEDILLIISIIQSLQLSSLFLALLGKGWDINFSEWLSRQRELYQHEHREVYYVLTDDKWLTGDNTGHFLMLGARI